MGEDEERKIMVQKWFEGKVVSTGQAPSGHCFTFRRTAGGHSGLSGDFCLVQTCSPKGAELTRCARNQEIQVYFFPYPNALLLYHASMTAGTATCLCMLLRPSSVMAT